MQFKQNKLLRTALIAGLFFFIYSSSSYGGEKYYQFNKGCQQAYYDMLSWHFEDAQKLLNEEKAKNPDNLIPYFIENYHDFLIIAFNEDKKDFDKLYPNKDIRLKLLSSGNQSSPYYLYTQAEVSLQWALINLKSQNFTSAFFDIRRAYNYLTENNKKFPTFISNNKSLGLLHALIGTVPKTYQWAVKLLGFSGTLEQGNKEIESVLSYGEKNPMLFTTEAKYIDILLKILVLNDKKGALTMVENPSFPTYIDNPLACFIRAYVEMKNFQTDKAISYFKYNTDYNKTVIHYNNYLLGMCMLNKLDMEALSFLNLFVNGFKGVNYVKDAYHRIAWIYLMQGNEDKYQSTLEIIKTKGVTLTDSDKGAESEAQKKIKPNLILLKARLLFDGGYYDKALLELSGKSTDDFSKPEEKIEFTYRAGRIYQMKDNPDKAILYFNSTIKDGEKLPVYFAANAAYESGIIYEGKGDKEKARYFFQRCLDMPYSDFKNSIDVKAKAGLARVSK